MSCEVGGVDLVGGWREMLCGWLNDLCRMKIEPGSSVGAGVQSECYTESLLSSDLNIEN